MINFEPITKETIYIAEEIIRSNSVYNILENGVSERSTEEIEKQFLNPNTYSFFIKADETYIGLIDYMEKNPKDDTTWIGLLMIHQDYQGYGYGTMAYFELENHLKKLHIPKLRLAVLEKNTNGHHFWEGIGFTKYGQKEKDGNVLLCYEKEVSVKVM